MRIVAEEGGREPGDSAFAVLVHLLKRSSAVSATFLSNSGEPDAGGRFNVERTGTLRAFAALHRADIILSTHGVPRRFRRRTFTVQLGHGVPIKAMGLENANCRRNSPSAPYPEPSTWDLVISPSSWVDRVLWESQLISGEILRSPLPRYDLVPRHRNRSQPRVGPPTVLYAPTYRHSKDPTAFNLLQSTIALNEALGEDARLVVRAHYLEHLDHPATDSITPLYELLASVDAVVTDFSSVAMDAVVLGIPVVFYCPDYEDYIRSPGFALDLEGVAPELCTTRARGVHDILTRFGVIERSAIASNSGFRKEYDEVARAMDSLRSLALEFESPFGGSEIVASAIMRRLLWIP